MTDTRARLGGKLTIFDDDVLLSSERRWMWELTNVTQAAQWVLCHVLGHTVMDDHCGMPEHRYCAWCRIPMPNAEVAEEW